MKCVGWSGVVVMLASVLGGRPASAQEVIDPDPEPPVPVPQPGAEKPPSPAPQAAPEPARPEPAPPELTSPAASEDKPLFGYDQGLFLRTPDDNFELKIGGHIQFRFTYQSAADPDSFFFSVPRARLVVGGHAFTPDFTMRLHAGWDSGAPVLKDAYIDYRFIKDYLQVRAGQFKKPFSRQQLVSDAATAFVDRSIMDRAQGAGRDVGIMLHNGMEKAPMVEYGIGVFNGTGDKAILEDGSFSNVPDQFDPLLAWRMGLNIGGIQGYDEIDFRGDGVGFAVALDGQARFNADRDDDGTVVPGADFIFKAYGLTTEGRMFLQWNQAGGRFRDLEYAAVGFHLEANYLIAKTVAPMARYVRVMPTDDGNQQEILGGVGIFVYEHKLQAQFDGGALLTDTEGQTDVSTQWRTQLQGAF